MAIGPETRGPLLILVSSTFFHSLVLYYNISMANTLGFIPEFFLINAITVGVTLLLYPAIGCLAELCFTHYRTMVCGVGSVLLAALFGGAVMIINYYAIEHVQGSNLFWLMASPPYVLLILGYGMFECGAIQFGISQFLEPSTELLKRFVHWYYWSLFAGPLVIYYMVVSVSPTIPDRTVSNTTYTQTGGLALGISVSISLLSSFLLLCVFLTCKRSFNFVSSSHNPVKSIFRVLLYACRNRRPSGDGADAAQSQAPSRIDLGKRRYGGPFSSEEVENVKVFFRILIVLVSLVGFQLSGDTYSLGEQLQSETNSCASLPALILLGLNPNHLTFVLIVVGIPTYELIIRKCLSGREPLLLRKMYIGIICSFLSVSSCIVIMALAQSPNDDHPTGTFPTSQITQSCFGYRLNDSQLAANSNETNVVFWWLALPQLLNGLSHLLVFMTALEFICICAPQCSRGLLTGLWFSSYSIRSLLVGLLDNYVKDATAWYIYQGLKALFILGLAIVASQVARSYSFQYQFLPSRRGPELPRRQPQEAPVDEEDPFLGTISEEEFLNN